MKCSDNKKKKKTCYLWRPGDCKKPCPIGPNEMIGWPTCLFTHLPHDLPTCTHSAHVLICTCADSHPRIAERKTSVAEKVTQVPTTAHTAKERKGLEQKEVGGQTRVNQRSFPAVEKPEAAERL